MLTEFSPVPALNAPFSAAETLADHDCSRGSAGLSASVLAPSSSQRHDSGSLKVPPLAEQIPGGTLKRAMRERNHAIASRLAASPQERLFSAVSVVLLLFMSITVMIALARYQPSSPFERYEVTFWGN